MAAAMGASTAPRTPARGEPARVRIAQRQARLTLGMAAAFALAAPVAVLIPHRTGWWLPLHLFLVGGLLGAISGAAQLFAVTWAAGPPPSDRQALAQRALIGAGAALLAAGRELHLPDGVAAVGGAAVIAGLVLLAVLLVRTVSGAVQRRFDPALRFYLTGIAAGLAGCAIGVILLLGAHGPTRPRLLAAHVSLNLLGLVGLIVAGTLPFFAATEARTKICPRATSRSQGCLLAWLAGATGTAAIGLLAGRAAVAAAGLAGYAAGLAALTGLLPHLGRKQIGWAGPRLLQLRAGVVWWAAGVALAAIRAGRGEVPFDHRVLAMIAIGGYAQVLLAALAYLAPVLRSGGHERLTAGFALTRSWPGLVAANLAAAALVAGHARLGTAAIVVWAADSALRALLLYPDRRPMSSQC